MNRIIALCLLVGAVCCWIRGSNGAPFLSGQPNGLLRDRGLDTGADVVRRSSEEAKLFASVPTYMRELYDTLSKQQHQSDGNVLNDADSVRSYFDEGTDEDESLLNRYKFNLSDINNRDEKVRKAELHLYHQYNPKLNAKKSFVQINIINLHNDRLVSSQKLKVKANGWITFPITKLVKRWVRKPAKNQGIQITFSHAMTTNKDEKLKFGTKSTARRQPILVVFTKSTKGLNLASILNLKPSTKLLGSSLDDDNKNQRSKRSNDVEDKYGDGDEQETCRLVPLKVSLLDINMDHKLVSPTFLEINKCVGSCKKNSAFTYHGFFQYIEAVVRKSRTDFPCCAPSAFRNTVIITSDLGEENKHIRIVNLEKAIATSCKCL